MRGLLSPQNFSNMGIAKSLISGLGGSLLNSATNVAGSLISANAQNKALKKQIKAQSIENEKNRKYNKELAEYQNKLNVEQWNRENKYNSPAEQMRRFQEAGLNPNLIYGQMSNAPQLSGSLSSGAPSTPQDMSPLGNMRSVTGAALSAIDPLTSAQIDNIKADTSKKNAETKSTEIQNFIDENRAQFEEWLNKNQFMSPEQIQKLLDNGADSDLSLNQWKSLIEFSQAKENANLTNLSAQEKEKIVANYDKHINAVLKQIYKALDESDSNIALNKQKLSNMAEELRQSKELFEYNVSARENDKKFQFWDKMLNFGRFGLQLIGLAIAAKTGNAALAASIAGTMTTEIFQDSDGYESSKTVIRERRD